MSCKSRLRLCIALLAAVVLGAHGPRFARADDNVPAATEDELIARFEGRQSSGNQFGHSRGDVAEDSRRGEFLNANSANFDSWKPLIDECDDACQWGDDDVMQWDGEWFRPMDRLRQFGFRHSSTHGRHVGRGLPLERSSWMNRPLHVDWFAGPLLSDQLVADQVGQSNDVFAGVRVGWDLDYYWGLDWRFGWSSPLLDQNITSEQIEGSYFVSDLNVVYYPWGDSKIRPYLTAGMGMAQIENVTPSGQTEDVTLLGMPFGFGIRFLQTPWLSWRMELMDNLAWGNDGVRTLNNFSFTAGMEFRLGARRGSYWPWRSSRRAW